LNYFFSSQIEYLIKVAKTAVFFTKTAVFLVRVVIQNFLKKPVISTVFKADE